MSPIREFLDHHFLHFNSRDLVEAARAWEAHCQAGGKMLLSLAGAMSTAGIGRVLSRLIEADLVHAISCTGANLEEDLFLMLSADRYERLPNWRGLSPAEEQALYERGYNRVTDTAIPEDVMRGVADRLLALWKQAGADGRRLRPSEYMLSLAANPEVQAEFVLPKEQSWLVAAAKKGVPVFTPGWEDSTTGNMFTAHVWAGRLQSHDCVVSGTEQMAQLGRWYLDEVRDLGARPSVGFFQVGGGIAGDFAICAVPMLIQDLELNVPFWGYFAQISDAVMSYGGYSGAPPNEKITWGKLTASTPRFQIQSDATICFPLVAGYLLGD